MRIVCVYKPTKSDPERVRLCAGGDQLTYLGDTSTLTVDLTTVKVHVNSVILTPGAKYLNADVKNFYLGTPMEIFE